MREIQLLAEWADSIINEFAKDGNLPLNQDPIRQTQIKYPHLSRDEAASKYLDDITGDFKDQNAVINAQSKKSDKLEKVVGDQNKVINALQQEVDTADGELDRLKSLSGQIQADQATRKISRDEVAGILDQVKELQAKPGMTDENYAELKKRVDEFKRGEVDPQKFEEFKNRLDSMSQQKSVDKSDFERLQTMMSRVEKDQAEVETGRGNIQAQLTAIEKRQSEVDNQVDDVEEFVADVLDTTQNKADIASLNDVDEKLRQKSRTLANKIDKNISSTASAKKNIKDLKQSLAKETDVNLYQSDDIDTLFTKVDNVASEVPVSSSTTQPDTSNNQVNTPVDWARKTFDDQVNINDLKNLQDVASFKLSKSGASPEEKKLADKSRRQMYTIIDSISKKIMARASEAPTQSDYGRYINRSKMQISNRLRQAGRSEETIKSFISRMDALAPGWNPRVSESKIEQQLSNLAENILGEQYAKYLK